MRKSVPRSRRQYGLQSPALDIARELPGVRIGALPKFIEPALATDTSKPPSGANWVHEIKFDGYRAQLHKRDHGTKMFTRRGYNWSDRFRNIIAGCGVLNVHHAVLDGEVVILTPEGRSDFQALEGALAKKTGDNRLIYYAFDILYLETFDLRGCTLFDRKRVLYALLENAKGPIRYSEHLEASGSDVYAKACELELEGIVSKRADGKYESGRTSLWMKTTCRHRDTFVVAGVAQKQGRFDGLYLGRSERGKLIYAGKLERGFSEMETVRMMTMFSKLKAKKQPIRAARRFPKAQWLEPRVLVDAEFRGTTGEGLLRHPAFKGIRRDLMD